MALENITLNGKPLKQFIEKEKVERDSRVPAIRNSVYEPLVAASYYYQSPATER